MGVEGLRLATETAILNAIIWLKGLRVLIRSFIVEKMVLLLMNVSLIFVHYRESAGIDCHDICKRLMDYGFHGPTVSWPVAGTLMIEPTESESKKEIDLIVMLFLLSERRLKILKVVRLIKRTTFKKCPPCYARLYR